MRGQRRDDRTRVNERIRVREVRVIDDTGQQLGIMPPQQALTIARQKGLDLVEVSATAVPPVCRIMDFGRYQYLEQKRARQAKKQQKTIEIKEIKIRPKVDEHDYQFKMKHVREFLMTGSKVRTFVLFRGREMTRIDFGQKLLERLAQDLTDIATIDMAAKMEGRSMTMVVSPRSEVVKQAQASRTVKAGEKERDKEHEEVEEAEAKPASPDDVAADTEKIEN